MIVPGAFRDFVALGEHFVLGQMRCSSVSATSPSLRIVYRD